MRQTGERQTDGVHEVQTGEKSERKPNVKKKLRSSKQNNNVGVKVSRQTSRNAESSDSSKDEDCVSDEGNLSHSQGQTSHPISQGAKGYTAKMLKTFLQERNPGSNHCSGQCCGCCGTGSSGSDGVSHRGGSAHYGAVLGWERSCC